MKIVKRVLFILLLLIVVTCAGGYYFATSSEPEYSGDTTLNGLNDEVEVLFDPFGIPHIYAQSEEDLFFAMGYVHAQDRLFQMEMARRVASGTLSEILGPDLVSTDILFRTMGLDIAAKSATKQYLNERSTPMQKAALAYLDGVNQFIEVGPTPPEFTILGIEKTPFVKENYYHILGYMAFGFAMAQREEPLIEKIRTELGPEYLADWVVNHREGMQTIPITNGQPKINPATALRKALEANPVPLFIGSNAWVIGPDKSASGKPILANDAHIGYSQPATWYEAHLECPGTSIYGHFLAGFPFAVIGHNRDMAWGITMLQNDDMDFYREKINPVNKNQVWFQGQWEDIRIREESLPIKDQADSLIQIKSTRHGPIITEVFEGLPNDQVIAMSWTYLKENSRNLQATFELNKAKGMDDARKAASQVIAPGLNLMFADKEGNIAWWASGRWTKYGDSTNSQFFLDGGSGKDEAKGLMDFSENPRAENPETGFVYSANNQPAAKDSTYLPGQYAPEDRARRIFELLSQQDTWTVDQVKEMSIDTKSDRMPEFVKEIAPLIARQNGALTELEQNVLDILTSWDGQHHIKSVGPTIYMKLVYFILQDAIADELGQDDFVTASNTFLLRRTLPILLKNNDSPWWDNIQTSNRKETRQEIFANAFFKTVASLSQELGPVPGQWHWGKVHTFEVGHPIGRVEPMDKIFNVGPFPAPGGTDVINNISSGFNASGLYQASYGPSKRIIIDMADVENGYCILPTGNSGHPMSPHYADQAEMYLKGEFRKMMMNREEIVKTQEGRLVLMPEE